MSFSSKVKEELSRQISTARHCQIAEIAAILSVCGQVSISANDHFRVIVHTENVSVARKYFTLIEKTFNIEAVIHVRKNVYLKKSNVYRVEVSSMRIRFESFRLPSSCRRSRRSPMTFLL